MSLLRPISIFLRNALVKQHPYFSCCASCGEITTPLESRLCTSLAFTCPVDAVILTDNAPADELTIASLERHCPWLRYIFTVRKVNAGQPDRTRTARIHNIPAGDFTPSSSLFGPEAHCHNIPGISDYFLIVPPDCSPARDFLPLDFFTPNGIPLLRFRKDGNGTGFTPVPGIIAQTRENAVAFLLEAEKTAQAGLDGYYGEATRWAFHAGKAVPANV